MKNNIHIRPLLLLTLLAATLITSGFAQTREDLFMAIENDDAPKVAEILKAKPDLANETDEVGFFPLTRAAGKPAVWKILLANAAAVNSPPMTHVTVLQSAIQCEDVALVEALLAKGCRVEDENALGMNAFHWLCRVHDQEAAKKIFAMLYPRTKQLVDQSATNMDTPDYTGTPLWFSVSEINPTVAAMLTQNGADPNKQPAGPGSSAVDLLRKRMAEEPELRPQLQEVAKAMGVTP